MRKIAQILAEVGQPNMRNVTATVTAVNADGSVDVSYLGTVYEAVAPLASYTPRVIDDLVVLMIVGDIAFVLGKLDVSDEDPADDDDDVD